MKNILYITIFLSTFNTYAVSFDTQISDIAKSMASSLNVNQATSLRITTIEKDKSYMLSLGSVYKELREKLQQYVKDIRFTPFRGEGHATIYAMIVTGSEEYSIDIHRKKIDSLILTGTYNLKKGEPDKIYCVLKIIDKHAAELFESDMFLINKNDCPFKMQFDVFDKLKNEDSFKRVEFKGTAIRKIDKLINSPNNNILQWPTVYKFVKKNPYAIQWQVDMLKEILPLKYGIILSDTTHNTIAVRYGGIVEFNREGRKWTADDIVDGEPMIQSEFPEEKDTLRYVKKIGAGEKSTIKVEKKVYSTSQEKKIREHIYKTFNELYPKFFTPLRIDMLDSVFVDMEWPSILTGVVVKSDPNTGYEEVRYNWYTKAQWFKNLKRLYYEEKRRFRVKTSVMSVFNDNVDDRRYWAIVRQEWNTINSKGNVVYKDDGFLLVNFDFDVGMNKLRSFKIYYRLWFYNYEYDNLELGIKRHEKLIRDLDDYFVNGVKGINTSIKQAMKDFLVQKVKSISINK